MRFGITTKIGIGLGAVVLMLLVASASGYRGINSLSQSLDNLMGPAWDTADGSMEGVISIQHQEIVLHDMAAAALTGRLLMPDDLETARKHADEAFGRMLAAGKLSSDQIKQFKDEIKAYQEKSDKLVADTKTYVAANARLSDTSRKFVHFMGLMEDVGDAAVEDLEKDPERLVNWHQLKEPWATADGAMETRIALLSCFRAYQLMVAGVITEQQAALEIKALLDELDGNVKELSTLSAFQADVASDLYEGSSYSSVLQQMFSDYRLQLNQAMVDYSAFVVTRGQYDDRSASLIGMLDGLEEVTDAAIEGETTAVAGAKREAYAELIIVMVVGLLIAAGAIAFAMKTISSPLARIAHNMRDISEGDGNLNVELSVSGNDEIAELAKGFNQFVKKIHNIISNVAEATHRLGASAEQLSSITLQTTQNMSQQQMETDQVATAMNEMAATVQEVSSNASLAAQSANDAHQATADGQRVVQESITTINKLANDVQGAAEVIQQLEQNSVNIGTILDVIKGIAEQTNLLALNAAIEAARAGEQGRGFAVVADEVRTLASRTQESTQEIEAMIESLQDGARNAVASMETGREQASNGVDRVREAGNALSQITDAVTRINDMNAQIASATEEQTAVTDEITRNIVSISSLSEQNSQGTQDISAASNELSQLASQLQGLVNQFKL